MRANEDSSISVKHYAVPVSLPWMEQAHVRFWLDSPCPCVHRFSTSLKDGSWACPCNWLGWWWRNGGSRTLERGEATWPPEDLGEPLGSGHDVRFLPLRLEGTPPARRAIPALLVFQSKASAACHEIPNFLATGVQVSSFSLQLSDLLFETGIWFQHTVHKL